MATSPRRQYDRHKGSATGIAQATLSSMKSRLALLVLLLLAATASAQSTSSNASFKLCESEAFLSLNVARNYLLFGRQRENVLPYLSKAQFDQDLAQELFRRVEANEIRHHAQFAAEKLAACAMRTGQEFSRPKFVVESCFAKVDIPFFLFNSLEEKASKEDAVANAEKLLPNRDSYPAALIREVAERLYPSATLEQTQRTMRSLFWNCVFP